MFTFLCGRVRRGGLALQRKPPLRVFRAVKI